MRQPAPRPPAACARAAAGWALGKRTLRPPRRGRARSAWARGAITLPGNLEVDLVVRIGHRVAVLEIKSRNKARGIGGIYQLNTVALERFLGSHTAKVLVLDRAPEQNNQVVASSQGIRVVVLPSWQEGRLSVGDAQRLTQEVRTALGAR